MDVLRGHKDAVYCLSFESTGKVLACSNLVPRSPAAKEKRRSRLFPVKNRVRSGYEISHVLVCLLYRPRPSHDLRCHFCGREMLGYSYIYVTTNLFFLAMILLTLE